MTPAIFVIVAGLLSAPPAIQVQTLSGRPVEGELVKLDEHQLTLNGRSGEETLLVEELMNAQFTGAKPQDTQLPVQIGLTDGSALVGSSLISDGKQITFGSGSDQEIKIPAGAVRSVQFVPLDDAASARWNELLEQGPAADLIAVRKKDAAATTFLEGVIGQVTPETVDFRLDGDTIPVKRDRVQGLIYYRKQESLPADPLCVVSDRFGGRLSAKQCSLAESQLNIVTVAGVKLALPLDQVASIDFSSGKITYLSDLTAQSFEWSPYLSAANPPASVAEFYGLRRDRGRTSAALMLGGKSYSKGLALTSRSEVRYKLPAGSRSFQAIVGIDDSCGDRGDVVLTIRGDDRELLQSTITGKDEPQPIDLDVQGIRQLTILVDFGEEMDIADYLNMADARVTK